MKNDQIVEIGIDQNGSLYVQPREAKFPYMYREAMEVGWDDARDCLYSPTPREWSYERWFQQLIAGAREQGVVLAVTTQTRWVNVSDDLRHEIEAKGLTIP